MQGDHDREQRTSQVELLAELQTIGTALVNLADQVANLIRVQQTAKARSQRVTLYLEARRSKAAAKRRRAKS